MWTISVAYKALGNAMAAPMKEVLSLHQQLKTEWAKKPQKLERIGELLTKLKVI